MIGIQLLIELLPFYRLHLPGVVVTLTVAVEGVTVRMLEAGGSVTKLV